MTQKDSAMAIKTKSSVKIHRLSTSAARRLFDREARRHLRMSGKEFLRRWETGKFDGQADTSAVRRVAMLLPFGR